jgi:hypothetical protein
MRQVEPFWDLHLILPAPAAARPSGAPPEKMRLESALKALTRPEEVGRCARIARAASSAVALPCSWRGRDDCWAEGGWPPDRGGALPSVLGASGGGAGDAGGARSAGPDWQDWLQSLAAAGSQARRGGRQL